jgi:hypothetical protein
MRRYCVVQVTYLIKKLGGYEYFHTIYPPTGQTARTVSCSDAQRGITEFVHTALRTE